MPNTSRAARALIAAAVTITSLAPAAHAQGRAEVTINDTGVAPENLTSSRDGTVYFGSTAKGTIYRAAPGASRAEPWILASAAGLTRVLGVLADDRTNTLWVCQNAIDGRDGAPAVGRTALRSFDLTSGAAKGTYPFPPGNGRGRGAGRRAGGITPAATRFSWESYSIRRMSCG